jgi:hypothetical protein
MAEGVGVQGGNEAADRARVSALVARAGLRLPADQMADLVTAYGTDRAGFERLRAIVAADDEPVHAFRAARPAGDAPGPRR